MTRPYVLAEANQKQIAERKIEVAVLPWGATEHHNMHLPYGNDAITVTKIGELICQKAYEAGAGVCLLPTIPFGCNSNLLAFPMTAAIAWRDRHGLDTKSVGWVLAGRLPGAALGTWLLVVADDTTLTVVIAAFVLGAVAIIATGVHVERTPVTSLITGAASATASLVASIGGPPLALVYRSSEGPTIRASLSFVFVFGIILSVTIRIVLNFFLMKDLEQANKAPERAPAGKA